MTAMTKYVLSLLQLLFIQLQIQFPTSKEVFFIGLCVSIYDEKKRIFTLQ